MKILYVADKYDPLDHDAGSGVDYMIYQELTKHGHQLELVGPFEFRFTPLERIFNRLHRKIFSKRPAKYTRSYLRRTARQIDQAVKRTNPDVIFSKKGITLVFSQIMKPFVYLMDTTLIGAIDQWDLHTWLANQRMLAWEKKVIQRSSQLITNSEWSAKILRDEYHVPAEKISVYANPASLLDQIVPESLDFQPEDFNPIRILLVGRVYERKGIDIAIEAVRMLNQRGYAAELRIVGMDGDDEAHVHFMGAYRKTVPEELEAYAAQYRWANFLIHPARFEAAGIVPGEAAAFGVPTITNAAGGLATTVREGVSGVVLEKDSPAEFYVEAIVSLVEDKARYLELRHSTRKRFENELNWDFAGNKIIESLERAVSRS